MQILTDFVLKIHPYEFFIMYEKLFQFEETTGIVLVSFIGAILLSLISESPILNIEKILLRPNKGKFFMTMWLKMTN